MGTKSDGDHTFVAHRGTSWWPRARRFRWSNQDSLGRSDA